jgi:phospholipase C
MDHSRITHTFTLKPFALALLSVLSIGQAVADTDHNKHLSRDHTATPFKHVIVLIGENRTFDNIYGTYVPRKGQTVANLLSKGIVNADGTPGPNAYLAAQSQLKNIPGSYFLSQPSANKGDRKY